MQNKNIKAKWVLISIYLKKYLVDYMRNEWESLYLKLDNQNKR